MNEPNEPPAPPKTKTPALPPLPPGTSPMGAYFAALLELAKKQGWPPYGPETPPEPASATEPTDTNAIEPTE